MKGKGERNCKRRENIDTLNEVMSNSVFKVCPYK